MDNFPNLAKEYFQKNQGGITKSGNGIFLVRPDGVPIYTEAEFIEGSESSVGALLGGVWQAAKALSSFIPKENKNEGFRLSFDTSSRGVYILPLEFDEHEYYLGMIYFDEVNPGSVKSKLRTFLNNFNEYIETNKETKQTKESKEAASEEEAALFKNITDDEMDHLFSF